MSQAYYFIKLNFDCFQIVSALFVSTIRAFHIVNGVYFKSIFLSQNHQPSKYICNGMKAISVSSHDISRKILDNQLYFPMSDMPFCISSDGGASSSETTPGSESSYLQEDDIVRGTKKLRVKKKDSVKLKILNYNVLSQALLQKHRYLYKKQSHFILTWDYRKQLIQKDITEYKPDIFCLQEVEEDELPYYFEHLKTLGYRSVVKMKTRNRGDGLAIYYKHPVIQLKENHSVEFCQPGVIELQSRDNVGLIAKFEKEGKEFFVANTHLLYNPKRTEVRLAQLQLFLAELDRITRIGSNDKSHILLMGDFNSSPESPIIRFLVNGKLTSHYKPLPPCLGISPDCTHLEDENKLYHSEDNPKPLMEECHNYSIKPQAYEGPNETGYTISHLLNFSSVYDLTENEKRGVTTHQDDWVMVDYIFYTNGFQLISRISLPTASDCRDKVRHLPNKFFPSDHLLLAAEFEIL